MITRERLEELIKQGATVWNSDYGEVVLDDKSEICYGYYDREHTKIANTFLYALTPYDNEYHDICLEDTEFFETEEEMDWYLEFGNITRTETLSLPTWEKFDEMEEFCFFSKNHKQIVIRILANKYLVVETNFERYYTGDYTKDNYIEACRLAKKLFLGESIDEDSDN